jgi:hypothetical protein
MKPINPTTSLWLQIKASLDRHKENTKSNHKKREVRIDNYYEPKKQQL